MGKIHTYESLGLVGDARHLRLDAITRLARTVMDAPVATVSVIQPSLDRQFFSSCQGLPDALAAARETPLEMSICRYVKDSGHPLAIPDLLADPRTADNPLVLEHGLRSYIGVPIHVVSGQTIGALCCIKTEVCDWTDTDLETMQNLAACVDDLIVLRSLQIEEEQANRKLRAIAGARSGFVAHISHEIRTPLTGIVGSIRLLDRMKLDGTAGDLVALLNRSALRLLDIVNDSLDLARMDSGTFRIGQQECDLHRIATDTIDAHRSAADRKSIALHLRNDLAAEVYLGDRMALASVLDNLFSNAVKFTETGQADIRLSNDSYGNVRIEVADTGIGIPHALQSAIFDEFEMAGPRIARKYGGTGIGMAMVKRLVELMDGEIDLVSQPGHGTTITITLPLEPVAARPVEQVI
ncbi:MAG: ATP-binding protein [Paracoccaceae bacterium]|nr:ATP-binding protein [Paracoccaceae bacterium]